MAKKTPYKEFYLKLSGEALMGAGKFGSTQKASKNIAAAVNS
jgi:uridylate kinase